jgi:hypothetical protein
VAAAEPSKVKASGAAGTESLRSRLSRRAGGRRKITGGDIEPAITSNPANLRNIIITRQQDFGFGPGLISSDRRSTAARPGHTARSRLTVCPGATADFASDLWISAGADGTAYFSGTSGSASSDPPPVVVIASHSNGGGPTWQGPASVAQLGPGNAADAITASPTLADHAYLVWGN